MDPPTIEVGERFVKVSDQGTVWVAVRPAQVSVGMPPHMYLVHEKIPSRVLMMSVSALLDRKLFRRAEEE